MDIFVDQHADEPALDVRLDEVCRTKGLQPHLHARDGTADSHRSSAAYSQGDGGQAGLRVEAYELSQGDIDLILYARQDGRALARLEIEVGFGRHGFDDTPGGRPPGLKKGSQPRRSNVDVAGLDLLGGGAPIGRVVKPIEEIDVSCI